jgi:hypothetical protein
LQLALLDRSPDILLDFAKDLADFLDRAGAKGDADIVDAARRMQSTNQSRPKCQRGPSK